MYKGYVVNGFKVLQLCLVSSIPVKVERCPTEKIERESKACIICSSIERYHCLYDIDDILVEDCIEYKQIPPGIYPIYNSYATSNPIDYRPCPRHKYKPWPAKSYEITECVAKSKCTSEGQIICRHGNVTTDVCCICDHKNGYASLSTECCHPYGTEDCTCFKKSTNIILKTDNDNNCVESNSSIWENSSTVAVISTTVSVNFLSSHNNDYSFIFVDEGTPYFIPVATITFILFWVNWYFLRKKQYIQKWKYCMTIFFTSIIVVCCVYNILVYKMKSCFKCHLVGISATIIAVLSGCCVGIYMMIRFELQEECNVYNEKYELRVFKLLNAAKEGQVKILSRLADENYIDMADVGNDRRSALHLAACEGHVETVKYILDNNFCNTSLTDRWNRTAVADVQWHTEHVGSNDANTEIIKMITNYKPAITKRRKQNIWQSTAAQLISAAEAGDLLAIKRLHNKGTDMDLSDSNGRTTLHAAAEKGQEKVVNYLIDDCRVSPFVRHVQKRPIDLVPEDDNVINTKIREKLKKIMDEFLLSSTDEIKIANHNLTTEEKTIKLLLSASRGDIRNIKGYFKAGFDMNLADYDFRTALHVAVSDHQEHIVQYLIQVCNVNIDMKDRWGRTAVDEAIKSRKKDLVQLFDIRDKDLADTVSNECIAFKLLNAASLGYTDTLKSLHEDGCDMEMRDYDGRTALHLASVQGHLESVKFLIETCKVKANIPDRYGRTPYVEASNRKEVNRPCYDSILNILKEAENQKPVEVMTNDKSEEVNPILEVNDAAAKGNLAKIKSLGWVQMNSGDYLKETPLHVAAAKGQLQLVEHLVENQKVSLFVQNSFWQTPIRLARKKCKDWKKKLGVQGTSLGLEKEKPHSEWEEYGRDLHSDSESDDEYVNKEVDKDIHDRIKVFRDVSKYLCRKMRQQVKDKNVEEDTSLSRYTDDELTFLFLNNTFRGDIAAVKRYLPQVQKRELVDKPDYSRRTALHIAVSEGHYHLVIYFLNDLKVKTDLKDRWGNTPKDDAERNKDKKMIDIIDKYSKNYS